MTAPDVRTPGGNRANADQKTEHQHSATADAERIAKLRSTWPALAALAGYELRRMADGRWLVLRWNMSRELDEADVEAWLVRVGAMR